MKILDGRKLAKDILSKLKVKAAGFNKQPTLGIVAVGKDAVMESFVQQKRRTAERIGIRVELFEFARSVNQNYLKEQIRLISGRDYLEGVIVQLPLPEHINTEAILDAVPPAKDVDVLSSTAVGRFINSDNEDIVPPVAGAVKYFFKEYDINYKSAHIVVVGAGRLVGRPVAWWLLKQKVTFSVLRSSTADIKSFLTQADIIITGVGKPKFIKSDMVKQGCVIIDAGTSEAEGRVVGDADFDSVASRCSYITPVPGGIGPLTVAVLFENLVNLCLKKYDN